MRILSWEEATRAGASAQPSAATIGVFDGLHAGHMALVSAVVARSPELSPLAVTFRGNPKRLTAPHRQTGALFSLEQKLETLESAGIRTVVLIDFSGNFSKLAGKDFVSTLVDSCGVRHFVVGSDFKCGHRLSTDSAALREIALALGATTEIVDPVMLDGEPISSTRIRAAIGAGRMDLALAMLGRPYALDLRGLASESFRGSTRVSLRGRDAVLPAPGEYRASADGTALTVRVNHDLSLEWDAPLAGLPRTLSFQA